MGDYCQGLAGSDATLARLGCHLWTLGELQLYRWRERREEGGVVQSARRMPTHKSAAYEELVQFAGYDGAPRPEASHEKLVQAEAEKLFGAK